MWIVLLILIVFFCFLLPDTILPMLGIILGGGIIIFFIRLAIEEYTDRKMRKKRQKTQQLDKAVSTPVTVLGSKTKQAEQATQTPVEPIPVAPIKIDVKGI